MITFEKFASVFQSHAGSIEADGASLSGSLVFTVSIPRWFD